MSDRGTDNLKIIPISVQEAKVRMDKVKKILSDLKTAFKEFEDSQIKLTKLSKKVNPQEIAKLRYNSDLQEETVVNLRNELLDLDCVIKDLRTGLVDFVAIRNRKPVWLCYKRGENELKYYHGWSDGFVGRQLIDFE